MMAVEANSPENQVRAAPGTSLWHRPLVLSRSVPAPPPEAQWDDSHTCWAVACGRLCNRNELWEACGPAASSAPAPSPDAAVLAQAFSRWGLDLPQRVAGPFAWIAGNTETQTVLAATEPMAPVPLYYAANAHHIALAVHTKPLRSLPWIGNDPDPLTVVAFLTGMPRLPEASFYQRIRRLPGGHLLHLRAGQLNVRRFWRPPFLGLEDVRTESDFVDRFRDLVLRAVRARVPAPSRTAILLSGGFDSTAVAIAAHLVCKERASHALPYTYSSCFEGLPCDESERIRLLLANLPFTPRWFNPLGIPLTPESAVRDIARHDAPIINVQRALYDGYARAARDDDVHTLLTGLGGDELAIDYDYHVDLLRQRGITGWPGSVARIAHLERMPVLHVARKLARDTLRPRILPPALERDPAWAPEARRWVSMLHHASTRAPAPQFDSHTKLRRWEVMTDTGTEDAAGWWSTELQGMGLELGSPLQDRRLFELVLGVRSSLQPRSVDTGLYKPTLVKAFQAEVPSALSRQHWKPTFESYAEHVLALSRRSLVMMVSSFTTWKSSQFVHKGRLLRALTSDQALSGGLQREIRLAGVELWLQSME